jgi:hypothetical protein
MPQTRRQLTPHAQLALARRRSKRNAQEHIAALLERLNDPRYIPDNQRAKTACALNVILSGGWLFAVACAKAYVGRTWKQWDDPRAVYEFIDAENARFATAPNVDAEMVRNWNAPDYDCGKATATD